MDVKESKPGIRTSEFWVLLVGNLALYIADYFKDVNLPDKWQVLITGVTMVGYFLSRGLAKQGVPYDDSAALLAGPEVFDDEHGAESGLSEDVAERTGVPADYEPGSAFQPKPKAKPRARRKS